MHKDNTHYQLFTQLLENEDFEASVVYDNEQVLSSLSSHEKELLGLLMVRHGERIAAEDDMQGLHFLNRALLIAPDSIKVMTQAAHILSSKTTNADSLRAAATWYSKANLQQPNDPDLLTIWGTTLVHLGRLENDSQMLFEADQLLARASDSSKEATTHRDHLLACLRAQIWHALALHSGEADDYARAIEQYKSAALQDIKAPFFWNDYANALLEFGKLIQRMEVYDNVIELYQKAIRLDPRFFPAQFNLGVCYHRLYEATWKSQLFWQAHEQYSHCKILEPRNATLTYAWGRLLLHQGKLRREADLLVQACDHLETAATLQNSNSTIAHHLAEAFIWAGGILEDLTLLRHAESTLTELINANPEDVDSWCSLGFCRYELGYYFNDLHLVYLGMDNYRKALEYSPSSLNALYGLATCHLAIGELEGDLEHLKTALEFFKKASATNEHPTPQFLNDWGVALMKMSDLNNEKDLLEAAIEKFELAIDLDLSISNSEYVDPEWLYNYGCAFDYLGDANDDPTYYEKSIQVLTRVLEIDPDYAQAKYNLAMSYAHLGEASEDLEALLKSCELFKQLLIADQDDENAWSEWGISLINMAQLTYEPALPKQSHQYLVDAEGKFHHAIALGHLPAYYNLSCVYSLLGDFNASLAYLERAENNQALPSAEELLSDEWLEGLRHTEGFHRFWSNLSSKYGF
ncbi:MAG: tetratricopeptide repeat protein [Parachlamydiales bacterium]|jgi:tetratricopeptide (TPR) repeat protein